MTQPQPFTTAEIEARRKLCPTVDARWLATVDALAEDLRTTGVVATNALDDLSKARSQIAALSVGPTVPIQCPDCGTEMRAAAVTRKAPAPALPDAELAELERLHAAATPGPWVECPHLKPKCECTCGFAGVIHSRETSEAVVWFGRIHADTEAGREACEQAECGCLMSPIPDDQHRTSNGQLIAALRNSIGPLLARLRAAEAFDYATVIRAACVPCGGTGIANSGGPVLVSSDMASDAGDPELAGTVHHLEESTECEYCGRPIAAIKAALTDHAASRSKSQ